jgi:ABC-2 type transport system ATP-binding protein
MTVLGFLRFIAEMRGIDGEDRRRRLATVIERTALDEAVHRPIETLSKGYKRRVGLAQALIHDPPVLVMDEPTDGLDPNQKHEVRKLIQDMAAEKAIIISTHILEEVDAVCTRAVVIARGRIVADARPDELKRRSDWHNAVRISVDTGAAGRAIQLLGAVPQVREVRELGRANGSAELLIVPERAGDIAAGVSEALQQGALPVGELVVEQGRLDDVFRNLTTRH